MKKIILRSNEPGYAALDRDVYLGRIGREYVAALGDGVIESAFLIPDEHEFRENPKAGKVSVGRQSAMSMIDIYSNWKLAWWREAIQNAVDAGARNIYLDATPVEEGVLISCRDDGHGMDEDTLIGKFLAIGGSMKVIYGATGGFGKAKELLVIAWPDYEIRTRNLKVWRDNSPGADLLSYLYDDSLPEYSGTKITALMPWDMHTDLNYAKEYLGYCQLSGINVFVGGEKFTTWMRRGKKEFSLGSADVYRTKSDKSHYSAIVRKNGLFMFKHGSVSPEVGRIVIEVTAPSTEVFTSNRDGFRTQRIDGSPIPYNEQIGVQLDNFLHQLAVDTESAIKSRQRRTDEVDQVWMGKAGKVSVEAIRASASDVIDEAGWAEVVESKEGQQLSEDMLKRIIGAIQDKVGVEGIGLDAEAAAALLRGQKVKGYEHLHKMIENFMWAPDFRLKCDISGFKDLRRWKPENWTTRQIGIIRAWIEACRTVLLQLEESAKFGVGFIISDTVLAEYSETADGEKWLLINPARTTHQIWADDNRITGGNTLSRSSSTDLDIIYARAVHEVTHLVTGRAWHDERFASALTDFVAKTYGGLSKFKAAVRGMKIERPKRESGQKKRRDWTDEIPGTMETIEVDYSHPRIVDGQEKLFDALLAAGMDEDFASAYSRHLAISHEYMAVVMALYPDGRIPIKAMVLATAVELAGTRMNPIAVPYKIVGPGEDQPKGYPSLSEIGQEHLLRFGRLYPNLSMARRSKILALAYKLVDRRGMSDWAVREYRFAWPPFAAKMSPDSYYGSSLLERKRRGSVRVTISELCQIYWDHNIFDPLWSQRGMGGRDIRDVFGG